MGASSRVNLQAGHWVAARYDLAVHGGALGTVGLRVAIPKDAVIVNSLINVLTALSSGVITASTVSVSVESAGDIIAATATSSFPWFSENLALGLSRYAPDLDLGSADGSDTRIDDRYAAAYVVTTQTREVTVTIATVPLVAGKFDVFLQYVCNGAG